MPAWFLDPLDNRLLTREIDLTAFQVGFFLELPLALQGQLASLQSLGRLLDLATEPPVLEVCDVPVRADRPHLGVDFANLRGDFSGFHGLIGDLTGNLGRDLLGRDAERRIGRVVQRHPHCGAEEKAAWVPKRPCGREAAFSLAFSHDTPQSYIYVADGGSHVITVVRRSDLEVIDEFAGPGLAPGQLGRPHNLSVDPSGNIYVAEAAGAWVRPNPASTDSVQAGFRAQKFTFTGTRPIP